MLEKTFESPLDSKEIQPVHPKGNHPEYSLEGLMLKLKCQYFGHLMQRADSFEKTMEYYSVFKKNAFESVLMRWMKLEPIIQSEVSQKEKHQYSILTHIYGI